MIGKYIHELLFQFDSLTIPAFGTLVKIYEDYEVHPVDTVLNPPQVHIFFDVNITHNDGVLANYISEKESISFIQSLNKIKASVNEINKQLNHEKKYLLTHIGTFIKQNDAVFFEPLNGLNFDTNYFGLTEITVKQIIHTDKKIQPPKEITIVPFKPRKKIKKAVYITSIFFIPIITGLGLFFLIKYQNVKNISDFFQSYKTIELQKEIPVPSKNANSDKHTVANYSMKKTDSIYEVDLQKKSSNQTNTNVQYFIVAGSFKSQENAINFKQLLILKEYNPVIIETTNGMYTVCYDTYSNLETAKETLFKIRSKENTSAWILKK